MKTKNYLLFLLTWALLTPNLFGQYNYAEVLQKSMFFYECQESGELSSDNRVSWRANSALEDGSDNDLDLTGGWYDAGDHVKFNFPMAFSATALAWGGIDFADGYEASGQMQYLKRNLRWVNDYFIKCHTSPNTLWGQVGSGSNDHAWWGSAEVMKMDRPSYYIDSTNPGTDLAAETAAAMAASSMIFQDDDPDYAAELLEHAEQLYSFADNYRGLYTSSITDASGYYYSYSGYNDELVWGAIWLYRATGDEDYLDKAIEYYDDLSTESQTDTKSYAWGISWDDKSYGCYALLAILTGESEYAEDIERHLDYWTDGYNGSQITYTDGGLAFLDVWGALRYANNTGFLAMYYSKYSTSTEKAETYKDFAYNQANYALGDNPLESSYVVGFGENPPENPHHRTAHGAWANNVSGSPEESRHTLYGALVGGPNSDDSYEDDRSNYTNNEVACDYNALFSGVMAAMVEDSGGTALSDFPEIETPSDEYYTGAIANSSQDRYYEWSVQVFNHTAWPAREGSDYRYRIFVDITEGLDAGLTLDDYTVTTNNSDVVEITQLQAWDESENIYYTEVSYLEDVEIYPGGDQYDSKESQVRIAIPNDADTEAWDVTNDYSYDSDMDSGDRSDPPQSPTIPLYVDGELVFGSEPSPAVEVESITVDPSSLTMDIGDASQLTATISPSDATTQSVTWSSSNTNIATVTSAGYVTATGAGDAVITATAVGTDITATCDITVNTPPVVDVTGVSLDSSSVEVNITLTTTLTATINPSDATDQSVTWSSTDTDIATVSDGVVTGISVGTAYVIVTTTDGGYTDSCLVTVVDNPLPTYTLTTTVDGNGSIEISPEEDEYIQGATVTLIAIADDGYTFSGWSGDASETTDTISITMDSDKEITATFVEEDTSSCDFGLPLSTALPSINSSYSYVYVIGEGPDLSNITNFTMNWDLDNDGLYQFSMLTSDGVPAWWNDFLSNQTNTFSSVEPTITLSSTDIDGLDATYYAGLDDDNFVLEEETGAFTIYFSNSSTSPCPNETKTTNNISSTLSILESTIKVYPVPFKDQLNIDLGSGNNIESVKIYNTMGQLVVNKEGAGLEGVVQLQVSLPASIYILKVCTSNETITKTLISK